MGRTTTPDAKRETQAGAEYITLAEAARRWGISVKTLRRRISTGDLVAQRLGARLIRVRAEDVAALFTPTDQYA